MEQLALLPLEKRCEICKKIKPLDEFGKESRGKFGRQFACRPCYLKYQSDYQRQNYSIELGRKRNLKRLYGLTVEEYQSMFDAQGGLCAACGRPEEAIDIRTGQVKNLHVDHCHITGKIRALLCGACNASLGHLREDPERVKALLKYIEDRVLW